MTRTKTAVSAASVAGSPRARLLSAAADAGAADAAAGGLSALWRRPRTRADSPSARRKQLDAALAATRDSAGGVPAAGGRTASPSPPASSAGTRRSPAGSAAGEIRAWWRLRATLGVRSPSTPAAARTCHAAARIGTAPAPGPTTSATRPHPPPRCPPTVPAHASPIRRHGRAPPDYGCVRCQAWPFRLERGTLGQRGGGEITRRAPRGIGACSGSGWPPGPGGSRAAHEMAIEHAKTRASSASRSAASARCSSAWPPATSTSAPAASCSARAAAAYASAGPTGRFRRRSRRVHHPRRAPVQFGAHHTLAAVGYFEEHERALAFRRVHADITRLAALPPRAGEVADVLVETERSLPAFDLGPDRETLPGRVRDSSPRRPAPTAVRPATLTPAMAERRLVRSAGRGDRRPRASLAEQVVLQEEATYARAPVRTQLSSVDAARQLDPAARHRGPAGRIPAADPRGRAALLPRLQRTRGQAPTSRR